MLRAKHIQTNASSSAKSVPTATGRFAALAATALTLTMMFSASVLAADEEEDKPIEAKPVELGRPVEFERDVYPILEANCVACHNLANSESDLIVENVKALLKGGSYGPAVVPGKPEESYLFNVAARTEEPVMPPWPNEVQAKKLTPEQLGILKQWILEGAKAGAAASAANMQWQPINSQLNAIYAVDVDPFGRFAAAGRGGSVVVYDLVSQAQRRQLIDPALNQDGKHPVAHRDYIHSVAFNPDGNLLATAGFQVVKLWQRQPQQPAQIAVPAKVRLSASNARRSLVALVCEDSQLRILDTASQAVAHTIALPDAANVSALSIAGPEDQWIVVGNTQGHVTVLSRADGQQLAAADVPEQQIVDVHLLAATNKLLVLTANGTVQTFAADLAGGQLTAAETMQSGNGAYKQLTGNADTAVFRTEGPMVEVRKAASLQSATAITASAATQNASLSADGQRLLIITTDGKAELWNAADGKQVATLSQNMLASRHQQHQQKDKAAREARVNVVKGQIEEAEKRVTEHTESLKKAEEELTKAQAAKTEADTKLAEAVAKTAEANKALEAKPDDGELKKKVEEAQKAEQAAKDAVTTADNQLSSAEKGKQLTQQAIERATGIVNEKKQLLTSVEAELATSVAQLEQATQAAGQPIVVSHGEFAGSSPIVATIDQSAVRLWNAVDGSAVDVLPLQTNGTSIVCATDQSATLRQADGNLTTVNLYPQWQLSGVLGPDGAGQGSVFADRVLSLAFSPDGKLLAAGGGEASRTGELTLWSIPDGQLVRQFEDPHSDTIYGLEFSADGKLLATAAADKFVKVFNVSSGEHVRSYEGHTHHVMDVSWKGDGTTLASAGADNAIKVWNAETGEQARTITTYSKQVTSLQFIGMQDEFVSCSGDKRVFVHTAGNGKAVREFKGCPDYVYSSATTADGSIVAAGCEDGVLRIWNGKDGKEIASFAAE